MLTKKEFADFLRLDNNIRYEIDRVLQILRVYHYPNAERFIEKEFSYYESDNGSEHGNFIAEEFDFDREVYVQCAFPARFLFMINDDIIKEVKAWTEPGPIED